MKYLLPIIALAGCAQAPQNYDPSKMSAEQLKAVAADKNATVSCGKVVAATGTAVVVFLDTFCGIGLSPVSWFLVATPFFITALATAISIGTDFDSKILNGLVYETFVDKKAKTDDIPADSNTIA